MDEIKGYLKEVDLRSGVVGLGALILIILWAYQGHHSFFVLHFPKFRGHPYLNFYEFVWMNSMTFLLWFFLPIFLIKFVLKERVKDFGLSLGDFRFGGKFLLLGILVMALPLYFTGKNPEFIAEYPLSKFAGESLAWFLLWELSYLSYYIGFEFMFRGFMLFGLKPKIGAWMAIVFETMVSTLVHIGMTTRMVSGVLLVGKPEAETLSAIVAGLVFGAVALRTRSILWPLALHWFIGMGTDFFCLYHSGNLWR